MRKCAWWSADRPSLMKIWCVQWKRRFKWRDDSISSLSLHFPQISRSLLHEIVSEKLPFQLARSCAQCFVAEKAFCLWNSCLKAQQSTQMCIATHLRNCIVRSRTSDVACLVGLLLCFMTMPAHTHCGSNARSPHDIWLRTIQSPPPTAQT
jgi:hypothetical protein